MSQMKEKKKNKITGRELNETDISNTPEREFKVMVIKILPGLEKRVEDLSKTLNKDIENIKTITTKQRGRTQ